MKNIDKFIELCEKVFSKEISEKKFKELLKDEEISEKKFEELLNDKEILEKKFKELLNDVKLSKEEYKTLEVCHNIANTDFLKIDFSNQEIALPTDVTEYTIESNKKQITFYGPNKKKVLELCGDFILNIDKNGIKKIVWHNIK